MSWARPRANSSAASTLRPTPIAATMRDDAAVDRRRRAEPLDRLPDDAADREHDEAAVAERGEDRGAPEAVGASRRARAPRQHHRAPRHAEAEHVAEVVRGVGEQRRRMGGEPGDDADHDERDVERHPEDERAGHPIWRRVVRVVIVGVACAGRVVVRVAVVVVRVVVMVVRIAGAWGVGGVVVRVACARGVGVAVV